MGLQGLGFGVSGVRVWGGWVAGFEFKIVSDLGFQSEKVKTWF